MSLRKRGASTGGAISDKEAALIAAARRELGKSPPLQPAVKSTPPTSGATGALPTSAARPSLANNASELKAEQNQAKPLVTESPPKADPAKRMAMLIEAERIALADRNRRIKRNYTIGICLVMIPAFAYVIVMLVKLVFP
ncbi:MAG: hypothetical protein ACKVQK_30050 [Burkholderiales bacterium]